MALSVTIGKLIRVFSSDQGASEMRTCPTSGEIVAKSALVAPTGGVRASYQKGTLRVDASRKMAHCVVHG